MGGDLGAHRQVPFQGRAAVPQENPRGPWTGRVPSEQPLLCPAGSPRPGRGTAPAPATASPGLPLLFPGPGCGLGDTYGGV